MINVFNNFNSIDYFKYVPVMQIFQLNGDIGIYAFISFHVNVK